MIFALVFVPVGNTVVEYFEAMEIILPEDADPASADHATVFPVLGCEMYTSRPCEAALYDGNDPSLSNS